MCAGVTTTADRGFTWSDEETALLLQLWGGNDAQSELTGNKRNFVVYEKISETMSDMGYVRTASQCREKIKRMKREYTLTKLWNGKSKGTKKNMRFFEQFEKILLEKQSRNQNNALVAACSNNDELESRTEETETIKQVSCGPTRSDRRLRKIAPKTIPTTPKNVFETCEKEDARNPWTPDVVLVEDTPSAALVENQSSASTSSTNGDVIDRKRRKITSRMSFFKCMMDSLTLKFMKYQAESDAKLLRKIEELDNERTAMDERIQKMWLEFEEKQKADEKEHELNIMTNFQGIIDQIKLNRTSK